MDWAALSNVFIGIATLAMTTMTFRAVKESIRARRTTYVPHLAFKNAKFFGTVEGCQNARDTNIAISICGWPSDKRHPIELYFELNNIGLGAAREIIIDWDYQLSDREKASPYLAFITDDVMSENEEQEPLPFLEPNNKVKIRAPHKPFIHYMLSSGNQNNIEYCPKVKLRYQDLEGNRFSLTYKVKVLFMYEGSLSNKESRELSNKYIFYCTFYLDKNEMYKKN